MARKDELGLTDLVVPRSVRRIVILGAGPSGAVEARTVYQGKRRRKRQSRALRPLERWNRDLARATETFASAYLDKHERSNDKKRDGWLRDLPDNLYSAGRRSRKKIRLNRLFD